MKPVANPYAPLFDSIFELKNPVQLYRVDILGMFDCGDIGELTECCAVYWPMSMTESDNHIIILADEHTNTLDTYMGTLAHEYIHAWQEENGFELYHSEKTQFKPWARYLKRYYGITV